MPMPIALSRHVVDVVVSSLLPMVSGGGGSGGGGGEMKNVDQYTYICCSNGCIQSCSLMIHPSTVVMGTGMDLTLIRCKKCGSKLALCM